jgi:hypothetical protein
MNRALHDGANIGYFLIAVKTKERGDHTCGNEPFKHLRLLQRSVKIPLPAVLARMMRSQIRSRDAVLRGR